MKLLPVLMLFVAFTGCSPPVGFAVEDRPSAPEAELPFRCADSLGRTSEGLWVCAVGAGSDRTLAVSHGMGDSETIAGIHVVVVGAAVWSWDNQSVLSRFEEDPVSGAVHRTPDSTLLLSTGPITQPVMSFIAHEQDIVIATSALKVVTALPDRLELRSTTPSGFDNSARIGNTAHALMEVDGVLWAYGPKAGNWGFCSFSYSADQGVGGSGACTSAPATFVGISSGGMWLRTSNEELIRFYRPANGTLTAVEGIELPALEWTSRGGVPWAFQPDSTTMVVPRVEGGRLIIDRYTAAPGFRWAGATEDRVFEVGSTTRVSSR